MKHHHISISTFYFWRLPPLLKLFAISLICTPFYKLHKAWGFPDFKFATSKSCFETGAKFGIPAFFEDHATKVYFMQTYISLVTEINLSKCLIGPAPKCSIQVKTDTQDWLSGPQESRTIFLIGRRVTTSGDAFDGNGRCQFLRNTTFIFEKKCCFGKARKYALSFWWHNFRSKLRGNKPKKVPKRKRDGIIFSKIKFKGLLSYYCSIPRLDKMVTFQRVAGTF